MIKDYIIAQSMAAQAIGRAGGTTAEVFSCLRRYMTIVSSGSKHNKDTTYRADHILQPLVQEEARIQQVA